MAKKSRATPAPAAKQGKNAAQGHGAPQAAKQEGSGIWGRAAQAGSAAYGKIPAFSFMDRATFATLLFCVAAYLAFTAYIFFSTPSAQLQMSVHEGNLTGISQLAISPGEKYTYEAEFMGEKKNVSYSVMAAPGCNGLLVVEEVEGAQADPLCIPKRPSEYAAMESKLTFGNRSILLFSPWMLAAGRGFSWQLKSTSSAAGFTMETPMKFTTVGVETVGGREAYNVAFVTEGEDGAGMRYYIDSEKKVLLSLEAGNFTARLVSAPFALDWTKE